MKIRRSIAAAGAAVALGATGALVLPAVASAHSSTSSTHTLKFIAVQKATVSFTKATAGIQETDINTAGKTVGFDMLYFTTTSATTAAVNATIDTKGGFLYGTFNITKSGAVTNGKVTGGTGTFAGATGTITAKTTSSTKHAVTITYST